MCGFAGVVSFSEACPLPRGDALAELATGCSNDLAHRGPDGAGYWQNNPKNPTAMLVHRRLAVLDPTPRSDQPYRGRFDGRRLALAYNGEIFNFRELRGGLDRRWKTDGDTEVLLAAYAARGEACVEDFEGMFAFAVVDESEKGQPKLVLARDPAGEKPLFVAVAKHGGRVGGVAFASELTCLRRMIARLRWPGIELRPGMHALQDYLAWGYVPGADTIHVGISKLLPGHTLTVTREGATRQRYFDAGGVYELGEPDRWAGAVTLTRQLVGAAVRRRLISDVPIGCLLSGGIDSSVVALHMAEALQREGRTLQTFSIGFDDPRYDESPHAAEVAKHLGARHHAFTVRPEEIDVTGDLPKLARVLGEPFADSSAIPTQVLARLTRGHVTVALGGDGGDEVFGGYDRYRALRFARRLDYLPRRLRRSLAAFAERMRPGHPKSKLARLRRFAVTLPMSAGERYGSIMRTFSVVDLQRLLPGEVALQEPSRVAGRYFDAYLRDRDLVGAAAALDRATYLPGDLLVKLDRCSMLHALEVRSPFMDRSLLRLAGTLGENGLLSRGRGKRLLRDAFAASLPASVFGRSKMGFAVPISAWLRGRLRPMTRDLLTARDGFAAQTFSMPTVHRLLDEHDRERADHGARLYALLMLELWHRQAREDERPSTSLVAA